MQSNERDVTSTCRQTSGYRACTLRINLFVYVVSVTGHRDLSVIGPTSCYPSLSSLIPHCVSFSSTFSSCSRHIASATKVKARLTASMSRR